MSNFYEAMYQANLLYGTEYNNEDDFAEVGLVAWNLIGNKRTRLYRYIANIDPETLTVQLPCNAGNMIESVNLFFEDWNYSTNDTDNGDYNSAYVEHYIEGRKVLTDPFFARGVYAKYERSGDTLYFDKNYGKVAILYRGIILDNNDLPELTDSEVLAIATYTAYVDKYKKGLRENNK